MQYGSNERQILVKHFYKQLNDSMVGYLVNGNPVQRKFTLMNMANYMYIKMTDIQRGELLKTILYSDK